MIHLYVGNWILNAVSGKPVIIYFLQWLLAWANLAY